MGCTACHGHVQLQIPQSHEPSHALWNTWSKFSSWYSTPVDAQKSKSNVIHGNSARMGSSGCLVTDAKRIDSSVIPFGEPDSEYRAALDEGPFDNIPGKFRLMDPSTLSLLYPASPRSSTHLQDCYFLIRPQDPPGHGTHPTWNFARDRIDHCSRCSHALRCEVLWKRALGCTCLTATFYGLEPQDTSRPMGLFAVEAIHWSFPACMSPSGGVRRQDPFRCAGNQPPEV